MRSFFAVAFVLVGLVSLASAQPLIPATPGNQWVLKTIYTPNPITFSVVSTRVLGPRTVIDLQQVYPWATYSLLLSQDTEGVSFEGFSFGGNTYWNPAPAMLFRTDATAGQYWNTPLGRVDLLSKTATVASQGQNFTGVYLYRVGPSSEVWGFKPGYGIVSYSVIGIDFLVSSGVSNPYVAPLPSAATRPCPIPGLTSMPEDGTLSDAQREGSLLLATAAGSKNVIVGATWSELEPSQGTYDLTRITKELQLASKYGLAAVLNLRVPQTVATALPPYLAGRALNDPIVLSRLNALIAAISPILPAELKWVNIGYEVDSYGFISGQGMDAYLGMFDSARAALKARKPGISVGAVFSLDTSRSSDQMLRAFAGHGDHIAFTYYALTGDYEQRDPASPAVDIPLMISMANGKPVLLVEMGYSSAWAGQAVQAQFFASGLAALRKAGGSVALFSVWSYRDIPASSVPLLSMQFGQTSPAFTKFITSTGLMDQNNGSKAAWSTFVNGALPFASTYGCTGQ